VDLTDVCRELGVGIRVVPADSERRGALAQRGSGWEVRLMRADPRPSPITPHERFTIAHELGHYVLLQEASFLPQREGEYWLGEKLCQQFAARLLIDPILLDRLPEPSTAAELMASVNWLAKRAQVTAEPAAREVVARAEGPVAVGKFLLDPLPSTRRIGFRRWWVENRSWWGGRGGRRLAVYEDHPLAPVLESMRSMARGEVAEPQVAGTVSTSLRRRGGRWASFAAILTAPSKIE